MQKFRHAEPSWYFTRLEKPELKFLSHVNEFKIIM